ncbi:MAG: flippase [gamma proteobacterium symbiont of Taylorina sp.]|nr:flippase [gamma proteobacterium symbiont of Taylorina sp.]
MPLKSLSSGFRKYLANVSWLAFEQAVRLGTALVVGVLVARYLGPEAFGELNFAISFAGLFAAFSTLGLDNLVVKKLVRDTENVEKILGTTFALKLLGALLGFIFVSLFLQLPQIKANDSIVYIIAAIAFFQASNNIDFFFQAKTKNKYVARVKMVQTSLFALTRIVLIVIESDLIWFAWAYLLDAIVLALGLLFVFYKHSHYSFSSWRWDQSLAVSLLKSSWPLILSSLVISVYMKIDQVMLQYFIGLPAVGLYAAASRLSEIPYVIPIIIVTALFPAIINARKTSPALYEKRMRHLYSLMFTIALLVILPVTFLSDWIIGFLYGIEFSGSAEVLQIHIWTCIFVFWGLAMSRWVLAEKLQKTEFYYQFAGMVTNIILNTILIPEFGISGAAWSTLVSQFAANLCYPALFGRQFRLQIKYQIISINFVRWLFKTKVL